MAVLDPSYTIKNVYTNNTMPNSAYTETLKELEEYIAKSDTGVENTIFDPGFGPGSYTAANSAEYTTKPQTHKIIVHDNTELQFDDGETITGTEFKRLMKALRHIVEQDYPEELL